MYYKKCESKKCQCKNKCNHEYEVAYYEVKKQDNSKKCQCDIEKTEELIDAIEHKAGKVLCDLGDAGTALTNAGDALSDIPDLTPLVNALNNIAGGLKDYACQLENIATQLSGVNTDVDQASVYGQEAAQDIANAKTKQLELLEITECLEHQFEKTVCCLKKEDGGFPILIPVEHDCGCKEAKKCDCDWED